MTIRARVAAWWFAPAPAERLAALRIAIGGYALVYTLVRLPELLAVARLPAAHFDPVGVARVLAAPLPPALVIALAIATCVLLALFVAGIAFRVTAPVAAVALLWTLTYRNAWGNVFHTENLLVLHVAALACAPAADAWAFGARSRRAPSTAGYGWAIKLLVALTAATYVLAGIAKLRVAGLGWFDGEQLRNQIAIDNLRKAVLGDTVAALARPVIEHPSSLTVFAVLTLVFELAAPIALVGGRLARAWAIGAWAFHVGVLLVMHIIFPYPLLGVAFLPVFPVERVAAWRDRRRTGMAAP